MDKYVFNNETYIPPDSASGGLETYENTEKYMYLKYLMGIVVT